MVKGIFLKKFSEYRTFLEERAEKREKHLIMLRS
jgi:hypothetical protein